MPAPTFPPAHDLALRVHAHFAREHEIVRARDATGATAPLPEPSAIEAIIDAAFWASLRREEKLLPRVSLALLPIDAARVPLAFAHPLPLDPAALAKLAPAVERPGIHLGVWPDAGGGYQVWGTTRDLPRLCVVVEAVASGLIAVKQRGEPFGKFVNVAVVEGDQIKIVDERTAGSPECPGVLKGLIRADLFDGGPSAINVLVELAASMRAHDRGGTLLVVPPNDGWLDSIVAPISYRMDPPFGGLAELLRRPLGMAEHDWQTDLRRAVEAIAGLTAVDGATVVTTRFEVLAFGAKIIRRRGQPAVERVVVSEPIEGSAITTVSSVQLGGTRHLSAAQFVHDQRDASALVASQDGRFTVFTWSPREDAVHAYRIEALLL
jgi:sensor domain DACNV-containing protein